MKRTSDNGYNNSLENCRILWISLWFFQEKLYKMLENLWTKIPECGMISVTIAVIMP